MICLCSVICSIIAASYPLALWNCARLYSRYDADSVLSLSSDLAEVLQFLFAAEYSQASCCKSFHLKLTRHYLYRSNERNVLSDIVGYILRICDSACEDDAVNLAAYCCCELGDVSQR